MRLLHTADLHLGKVLHEQSLLDDQSHMLDLLVEELASRDYDLFLVAGDVFDRSVPPPEAVTLWDSFLRRVAARCPHLQTVIVSGNHDGSQRLAFAASFLASHRIHVRTRAEELETPVTITVEGREWDIFAVPFLGSGTLAPSTGGEAVLRTQRELWAEACHRLAAARRPGVGSILVSHLFTLGGSESDSERLFIGEAEQIPAAWLAGWDYVALGHLHRAQEPAPGVHYSGSPLAYSFSEAGQEKVALRWETGVVSRVTLVPQRPLSRLSGTYDDFVRGEAGNGYESHWLEITLTDAALVPGPLERLRTRFPGLLSLVQAPVRASAVADAPRRRTGDLAADALRFLQDVGISVGAETPGVLADLAQEARLETP